MSSSTRSRPSTSRTNEPVISFRFNSSGARKFGKFTKDHVGRPFAIVLDDKVISAPVIREPILGGSGQISGSFTVETANQLAIQLRSGALPAKLTDRRGAHGRRQSSAPIRSRRASSPASSAALPSSCLTIFAYGTFGVFAVRRRWRCTSCSIAGLDDADRLDADAARHRRPRARPSAWRSTPTC